MHAEKTKQHLAMKTILFAFLFCLAVSADTVAIQPDGGPLIITDQGTVNSNAVITPSANGWSVAFSPIFSSGAYSETLEILQEFTVPEDALFTLSADATVMLEGSGCSHGYCPGLSLSLLGEGMVSASDAVTAQFLANASAPGGVLPSAISAFGSSSQSFDLAAGNYLLVEFLNINAGDAGVWSRISVNANISLVDPPGVVPEARWTVLLAMLAFLAAVWIKTKRPIATTR
jgi:hypothetical protein